MVRRIRARVERRMRPVASPVLESRIAACFELALGGAGGAIASAEWSAAGTLFRLLFGGAIYGVCMHFWCYRRLVARALDDPGSLDHPAREDRSRTIARGLAFQGLPALALLLAVWWWNVEFLAVTSSFSIAIGCNNAWITRRYRIWEIDHHAALVREPRYRWRRDPARGGRFGGGIFDARDFYFVPVS